jgi:hypothetical protein
VKWAEIHWHSPVPKALFELEKQAPYRRHLMRISTGNS